LEGRVTQISFDAELLPRLEALYRTTDVVRRRRLVREALSAATGERVLDVGCGPGFYATELLMDVGPTGSVVGVDRSAQMLAAARHRSAGHENIAFREGEATALPVDDESFDAALCVQVLEYVSDVGGALSEIRRVVRPGGRAVVWDVDWSTVSLHSSDPARTRRVLEAWDGHLAHPALPRTLAGQLREAGFANVEVEGHAFAAVELDPDSFFGGIVGLIEQYVGGRDDFPREELRAWTDDLHELSDRGEFFIALMQFCFKAQRPAT
jgi:arsenite methyltransferase